MSSSPAGYDALAPRVTFFTGKGGVGKTTVVAALAVAAARRGHRPLVVELGHRASTSHVFGVPDIGYRPRSVGHGVFAMNMDFEAAVVDYVAEHVRLRAVAKRVVRSQALQRFFDAAPAVKEIVTLHRLTRLKEELVGDHSGRPEPRFHPILVDLDATGHALMFLGLPRVFDGIARGGPIRALLDSFLSLLADANGARLSLVTTLEELPVQETLELYAELLRDRSVTLGQLVINRIPRAPPGHGESEGLNSLEAQAPVGSALAADVALARRAQRSYARAMQQRERLERTVSLPRAELPELELDETMLSDLGERLVLGSDAA